jgi:hypothetical protein
MGRPSEYDPELVAYLCERIATSELGVEQILQERRDMGLSSVSASTIYNWKLAHPEFMEQSACAREMQAELLHDRAQLAAQTPLIGEVVKEIVYPATDDKPERIERTVTVSDNVERSKLIVQTTLKRAGQLNSKKYGDKLQHSGDPDAPLGITIVSSIPRPER